MAKQAENRLVAALAAENLKLQRRNVQLEAALISARNRIKTLIDAHPARAEILTDKELLEIIGVDGSVTEKELQAIARGERPPLKKTSRKPKPRARR